MNAALTWIGERARWVLVIGAFAGLAWPDLASLLRPALPAFVSMVYALAMLRVDPFDVVRPLARPRRAAASFIAVIAMLVISPALGYVAVGAFGLGAEYEAAVVYALAAPPIASAAAMCLIVGFSGARALQLTILASLLMPITGPLIVGALLGAAPDLAPFELGLRMAAMIFGGFVAALIGRRLLGADRIARNASALDGVAALGFLLFVLPLFDGVGASVVAAPGLAAGYLAFASLLVLGPIALALRAPGERSGNGAVGAVWGARSVAIYLAALPPDPAFALFVAIYQLPMAAIPLVFRRRAGDGAASSERR